MYQWTETVTEKWISIVDTKQATHTIRANDIKRMIEYDIPVNTGKVRVTKIVLMGQVEYEIFTSDSANSILDLFCDRNSKE